MKHGSPQHWRRRRTWRCAKESRQAGSSTQANLSELQLGPGSAGGPRLLKVERHNSHPMARIKLNQQEAVEQILRLRPSHINGVHVKNWEPLSNDPSAFLILWEGWISVKSSQHDLVQRWCPTKFSGASVFWICGFQPRSRKKKRRFKTSNCIKFGMMQSTVHNGPMKAAFFRGRERSQSTVSASQVTGMPWTMPFLKATSTR